MVPNLWKRLVWILIICLVTVLGALYAGQRHLIYFPTRISHAEFEGRVKAIFGDRASILAPFDAIVIEPPADTPVQATAILFHGNAALGLNRGYYAPVFAQRGLRLILAEYPGYGARGGAPTERTLVEDADALYAGVSQRYPDVPIWL